MSAHCRDCGTDLVYAPGTWPLGECPVCKRDEESARLKSYVALLETARSDAWTLLNWLDNDARAALGWTDGKAWRDLLLHSIEESYEFRKQLESAAAPAKEQS